MVKGIDILPGIIDPDSLELVENPAKRRGTYGATEAFATTVGGRRVRFCDMINLETMSDDGQLAKWKERKPHKPEARYIIDPSAVVTGDPFKWGQGTEIVVVDGGKKHEQWSRRAVVDLAPREQREAFFKLIRHVGVWEVVDEH